VGVTRSHAHEACLNAFAVTPSAVSSVHPPTNARLATPKIGQFPLDASRWKMVMIFARLPRA
jgi:hypothetical protein